MRKRISLCIWMVLCLFFGMITVRAEYEEPGTLQQEEETEEPAEEAAEDPSEESEDDTVSEEDPETENDTETEAEAQTSEEDPEQEEENAHDAEETPEQEAEEEPEPDEPEEPVSGPAEFTDRMYRIVLEREADASGRNDWITKLENGKAAGADLIYGFFMSSEMKARNLSDEEYVQTAYRAILDREADAGGLEKWTKDLTDGMTRVYVLKGFVKSGEFTRLCESYGIVKGTITSGSFRDKNPPVTRFVSRLYTAVFGRRGDDGGLETWCRRLLTKEYTAASAVDGFLFSSEYMNKKTRDDAFVELCYRVFFDREPDASGYAGWMARLDAGMSRRSVEKGFAGSKEFIELCRKYGLTAGTITVTSYRDRRYELTRFISDLYRGILGRKADTAGLEKHARLLFLKKTGGKEIVWAFIASQEYRNRKLNDSAYVQAVYSGALGRSASASETSSGVSKLKTLGRNGLLEQILSSAEFAQRCKKAGILLKLVSPGKSLDLKMSASSIAGFGGWNLTSSDSDLLRRAVNTVEGRGWSVGFVMLDLSTGKGVSYHPDWTFYSASAIKAPYIVSLAKYNYAGFTQMRSVAADVLHTSSNTGYASLWSTFHGATFAAFGRDANVRSAVTADMYAYLSSREMAKLWVVCDNYFNSGAAGNSVGAMCEDPNVSSIRASIPGNVRTRSKAGWISGYGYRSSTDAGIVYASNGRYVIAVLSDLPAAVNQLDPVVLALHTVHSHLKK